MPLTTAANTRACEGPADSRLRPRWNDDEFLNIFPGKTHVRTFLYANMLVEVWAIPTLGIRALFLRGAPAGETSSPLKRPVPRRILLGTEAERNEDGFRQRPNREDIGFCRWMSSASLAS